MDHNINIFLRDLQYSKCAFVKHTWISVKDIWVFLMPFLECLNYFQTESLKCVSTCTCVQKQDTAHKRIFSTNVWDKPLGVGGVGTKDALM